jgi:hypothetical protein
VSDVHVCDTAVSALVVVTTVPVATRNGLGLKANALMVMAADDGDGAVVDGGGGGAVVVSSGCVDGSVVAGSVAPVPGSVGAGAVAPDPVACELAAVESSGPLALLEVVVSIVTLVVAGPLLALSGRTDPDDVLLAVRELSPPHALKPTTATRRTAARRRDIVMIRTCSSTDADRGGIAWIACNPEERDRSSSALRRCCCGRVARRRMLVRSHGGDVVEPVLARWGAIGCHGDDGVESVVAAGRRRDVDDVGARRGAFWCHVRRSVRGWCAQRVDIGRGRRRRVRPTARSR